ncbi:MAG: Maf family protein [Sandaracinaceae bacterium]|nr:Maf family protein [Sandaracinaceae bacterium]
MIRVPLLLASSSPRRKQILSLLGIPFRSVDPNVDEEIKEGEKPEECACRIARAKAMAGRLLAHPNEAVLAADTLVAIDGAILGKPSSDEEAFAMLRLLSNRTHEVWTALALLLPGSEEVVTTTVRSTVSFAPLDESQIARYLTWGEHLDKAGAYAVQGLAMGFVESINGSPSNVIGLPAAELISLLKRAGVIADWPLPRPC